MPRYGDNTARSYYDGNTAPVRKDLPVERPKPQLVRKKRKSTAQLRAEARVSARQAVRICVISGVLLLMLSMMIYSRVEITKLDHEIGTYQRELNVARSEGTRLSMQLSSMVSLDKVEQYASEKLGMVQQQKHQVEYIDMSDGQDKVVKSGK